MKNRVWVGMAVACLLATALPAAAATFLALDQEELVAGSQAVIEGRVLDVRSHWTDDRTLIVSEARILVGELIAGEAPNVVVVNTPGGEVGDYRVEAVGFPAFASGDRVVLFLSPDGDSFRVTGHAQGHFEVRSTAKGDVAVPTLGEGVRLFTKDGRQAPALVPVQLDELKNRIRDRRGLIDLRDVR
jgi:hypothetical protein